MATRQTKQREIIEGKLHQLGNHPTAESVYEAVQQTHPSIGKATVYRTLTKLVEDGSALRVKNNNGADHFDHQTHPHYHVHCLRCGRVDDVDIPMLDEVTKKANASSNYAITAYSLQFDGVCPACLAAEERLSKKAI